MGHTALSTIVHFKTRWSVKCADCFHNSNILPVLRRHFLIPNNRSSSPSFKTSHSPSRHPPSPSTTHCHCLLSWRSSPSHGSSHDPPLCASPRFIRSRSTRHLLPTRPHESCAARQRQNSTVDVIFDLLLLLSLRQPPELTNGNGNPLDPPHRSSRRFGDQLQSRTNHFSDIFCFY